MFVCPRCNQEGEPYKEGGTICRSCKNAEASRISRLRTHQGDWIEKAKEAGVEPWERQPGETTWEYEVWVAYRDMYPSMRPTYKAVAQKLAVSDSAVRHIASRWTFVARLQSWIKYTDSLTLAQRRSEILDMNKEYVDMAAALRGKVAKAIELVDPQAMRPSDISSLMKTAADIERKARVDTIAQEEMRAELTRGDDNPDLKKAPTSQGDLAEVIQILSAAGQLGTITQIGTRVTKETMLMAKDGTITTIQTGDVDDEG